MATTPNKDKVPSNAVQNLLFNSEKLDEFTNSESYTYVDRLNQNRRTLAGIEQEANRAMSSYGYITKDSFEAGNTLDTPNTILRWRLNGEFYRWDGDWSQPKVVPAGSTPESAGGIGSGKWVSVGDAGLRSGLSHPTGAVLVGGSVFSIPTVEEARHTIGIQNGQKIVTAFHHVPVVSEWTFTTQRPVSGEFYLSAVGGYLVLMTPNFASAGIKQGNYLPGDALHNRDSIERLTRDKRFSSFSFGCTGLFYVLGSMHPLRDNIEILHEKAITLLGRYDDPVFLAQERGKNYGQMWGFALYRDLENGDFTVEKPIENVKYLLEGNIGTVFDSTHSKLHNNNAIGFYDSINCRVVGSGGVVSSDHRGVNFDGKSDNCEIDIGFARNTSNSPLRMSPENGKYGKVKVGSIKDIRFDDIRTDGNAAPAVVWCYGGSVDVEIADFKWDGITKPFLVYGHTADRIHVKVGTAEGLTHVLRQYNTKDATVDGGVFTNTDGIINKAETENMAGVSRSSSILNTRAGDSTMTYAFQDETRRGSQDAILIVGNNFLEASPSFQYFKGKNGTVLPALWDCRNNIDPRNLVDFTDWNLQTNSEKTQYLSARSFSYAINRRYSFISVQAQDSTGSESVCTIPLRMALGATAPVTYNIGKSLLTITRAGDILSGSLDTGVLRFLKSL